MSGSKNESDSDSFSRTFVDPRQRQYLNKIRKYGWKQAKGMMGKQSGFKQKLRNPTRKAHRQMLNGGQQNPELMAQIEQGQGMINENLTENILPALGMNATAMGQRGSSRQGIAEGLAVRGAMDSSADFASDMMFNDFNARQDRQMAAIGMSPMIAGLDFAPLQNFNSLVGAPSVLSEGNGSSNSKGKSAGFGMS